MAVGRRWGPAPISSGLAHAQRFLQAAFTQALHTRTAARRARDEIPFQSIQFKLPAFRPDIYTLFGAFTSTALTSSQHLKAPDSSVKSPASTARGVQDLTTRDPSTETSGMVYKCQLLATLSLYILAICNRCGPGLPPWQCRRNSLEAMNLDHHAKHPLR